MASFTLGERVHSSSMAVSYDSALIRPLPNAHAQGNYASTGSMHISLLGHSFAVSAYTQAIRVSSRTAQETTEWISDSIIAGRAAVSLGRSLTALVTSGMQLGASASGAFSADVALASSVHFFNSAGVGQLIILSTSTFANYSQYIESFVGVYGSGFGVFASCLVLRTGHTQAQASHWHSDSEVMARKPHGVGGSQMLLLTAAVSLESSLAMLSYDMALARLHRGGSAGFGRDGWEADYLEDDATNPLLVLNSPSTGSLVIILKAAQLSKHDYSLALRGAASAAEVTIWTSDTLCSLQTAGGDVWSQPITATLALQVLCIISMCNMYIAAAGRVYRHIFTHPHIHISRASRPPGVDAKCSIYLRRCARALGVFAIKCALDRLGTSVHSGRWLRISRPELSAAYCTQCCRSH